MDARVWTLPGCRHPTVSRMAFPSKPLSPCERRALQHEDWARLHTKFGACTFVSAPITAAGGVLGALTVAGGRSCEERDGGGAGKGAQSPCVDRSSVGWFAQLLAEALVRRNCELLLQVRHPNVELLTATMPPPQGFAAKPAPHPPLTLGSI